VWYLDDGTIAGVANFLLRDFELVKREGPNTGLLLNESKCEIITDDFFVAACFQEAAPIIVHVIRDDGVLLGAPVGSSAYVTSVCNANSRS
jgi:hypothetical protein